MTARKTAGLRVWMRRVLEECDRAAADFAPDPVHDLRVALRRCRSLADGMMAMDPDPEWGMMKKAGRRLFGKLGELRDAHVMMDWVAKLGRSHDSGKEASTGSPSPWGQSYEGLPQDGNPRDPVAQALLEILARREKEQVRAARLALNEFDRKQWRQWSRTLPRRAARIRLGSLLFKHLALERWIEAHELHRAALRNRSQTAFHRLRIGIKRFRYTVENFLPELHLAWSHDLKDLQDLLGEVHDLDVLWATASSCQVFPDEVARARWHARILAQRTGRIDLYREKMVGAHSLWNIWRAALPQGRQIHTIATNRIKLWAKVLDPDFEHSQRVTGFAMQLFEDLTAAGWLSTTDGIDARSTLLAAGLLHDVGKSKQKSGHHKASFRWIRNHDVPLGWKTEDLRRAAIVARYHCGALPTGRHKALRELPRPEQKMTIQLAAILRLANALDAAHDGRIRRVRLENQLHDTNPRNPIRSQGKRNSSHQGSGSKAKHRVITIAVEGYARFGRNARAIAAERHLLETVLRRPVFVKRMKNSPLSKRKHRLGPEVYGKSSK
jgi:CHAD domain-containing protein/HD superfamily phosphodiesterase